MHLPQPLFRLRLEVHYNIQSITLIDVFIPNEDDWIQHKPKHQRGILDIIDLHREERIFHHAGATQKYNIKIAKPSWILLVHVLEHRAHHHHSRN